MVFVVALELSLIQGVEVEWCKFTFYTIQKRLASFGVKQMVSVPVAHPSTLRDVLGMAKALF